MMTMRSLTASLDDLYEELKKHKWNASRGAVSVRLEPAGQDLYVIQSSGSPTVEQIAYAILHTPNEAVRKRLLKEYEKDLWEAVDHRSHS